jgi:hypothetical protein
VEACDHPYENRYWETLNNVPEALMVDENNIPIMAAEKVLDMPFSPLFGIHLKYVTLLL